VRRTNEKRDRTCAARSATLSGLETIRPLAQPASGHACVFYQQESAVMTVANQLAEYIRCNISPIEKASIDVEDDLLAEGLIDSLGIVQLLEFISENFAVNVDADEIQPENFATVRAIETLIVKKRA
jgi:acyl carrier protein